MDVKIIVKRTEYQQMEVLCPRRDGLQLIGEFPEHVVGSKQYGPRLRALGAALVTSGVCRWVGKGQPVFAWVDILHR